ncbi:MAG TPA: ATP-dependent DNA helicase [Spirochaetota bacterium]
MEELFGKEGCLKDILPLYEYRRQQRDMAHFMSESLIQGGVSFIEAGTGTGKTLAYLIPALEYCLREGKILAISTETKTLQKQLIDKDIPLVEKVFREYLGQEFRYSLCLGSANYPCARRFEILLQRGGFLFGEQDEVAEIAEMMGKGIPFNRYDVKISAHLWHEIERDSDMCKGQDCPQSKNCPFQRAKREWFSSHILVMNHYLFFSNVAAGKTYLPKFDCVVFDEAHSIEQIASKQLGFELSYPLLIDVMERFHHRNKKMLLPHISRKDLLDHARSLFYDIEKEGKRFFDFLTASAGTRRSLRVRQSLVEGEDLYTCISDFIEVISSAKESFSDEPLLSEYEAAKQKILSFQSSLEQVIKYDSVRKVMWIEKDEKQNSSSICGSPVEIGQIMEEDVFSFYENVSFVSATLAIHGDFSFIEQRLGVKEARTIELDSPFDYESRVLLYLPEDLPLPQERGYIDAAAERSAAIIDHVGGNCLILFTSYEMLREFVQRLQMYTTAPLIVQGNYDPVRAIAEYCDTPGAVLLGTHSFWQGLDLPGHLLKGVIITKLPFPVPDRPDVEARCDLLEKKGINPFTGYHVPSAIIQFKQGFGRLMRRSDDAGIVAVLDGRIVSKGYGRHFIDALPPCRTTRSIREVEKFVNDIF